ncbi:MAG: hypothetical protein E7612_06620 [Ruminococcaceae bacterium]|nr:hypothetical protein [Oscillospiraceae bacterium]
MNSEFYSNIVSDGDLSRTAYKDGFDAFIKRLEKEGNSNRENSMLSDGFAERIEEYRSKYISMLGLDRISDVGLPEPQIKRVGEDEDAVIYKTVIYVTPEIPQYGILFVPHGVLKAPLVVAQHGGGGTPELCSDMNGSNSYNHMVRRLLKRGVAVYAPQLLLWNFDESLPTQPKHDIPYNRDEIDKNLKRFGISLTAVEIKGIMNSITFLSGLDFIDSECIAMTGLSYGGYFTLHTMAADTRIKAGFSNACFNDRNAYPRYDWTYHGSANTFQDAEVAALCAPRKLYVAVGKADGVFDYKFALAEAERAKRYYESFGCPENFVFYLWDGGHTVTDSDEGFDFLLSAF